jgi:uncharacterized protein YlzI (FlbEa/FlbD family)
MIELEILKSSDEEILGKYVTFKNDLIIGKSLDADLPISDPGLDQIHAIIRLNNKSLMIKTLPKQSFYLLNGKKFSGEKILKHNDKIIVGETELSIKNFLYDPKSSPGDFKEYYKNTITQFPETGILLEVLEREIADLSNNQDEL